MREWLSGGAPPCQGGGRGFESRLALFLMAGISLILQGVLAFYIPQNVVDSLQSLRNELISFFFGQRIVDYQKLRIKYRYGYLKIRRESSGKGKNIDGGYEGML